MGRRGGVQIKEGGGRSMVGNGTLTVQMYNSRCPPPPPHQFTLRVTSPP